MADPTRMKPGERIAYHVSQLQKAGVPWNALQGAMTYAGHLEVLFRNGSITISGPGGSHHVSAVNLDDPFLAFQIGTQVLTCADDYGCVEMTLDQRQRWENVVKRIRDAEKRGVFSLE